VDQVTRWLRAAAEPAVVRRAVLTSILVGSVLVLINHASALVNSGLSASDVVPIALTYAVPYIVSTASSIAAARTQARLLESEHEAHDRAIESLSQVPGQNPNPVLRLTRSGRLVYANASSAPLRVALGIEVGGDLPADLVEELRTAAKEIPPRAVEHTAGIRTFSWLPIEVPDLELINLYGTDITAEKVVERFPGRNPNPVMRMSYDGRLIYANEASEPITQALGIVDGAPFPAEIADRATDWLAGQVIRASGSGPLVRDHTCPGPRVRVHQPLWHRHHSPQSRRPLPRQQPEPRLARVAGGASGLCQSGQ
jgi:hypothetical protein